MFFVRRPELDRRIRKDLKSNPEMDPINKAILMLNNDLQANPLLQKAWTLGNQMRPKYASVSRSTLSKKTVTHG